MTDQSVASTSPTTITSDGRCVADALARIEAMMGGSVDPSLPVPQHRDLIDAIGDLKVLVSELRWRNARTRTAEEEANELRAALAAVEARHGALLKTIPDLMFVLGGDGTYIDYRARDPKLLFVPPNEFLGRTICEVMPPPLADTLMDGLERAAKSDDPVFLEYDLPTSQAHFFETCIVRAGTDQFLAIVRDVTEAKRMSELVHDLAGRLIDRQEAERQRLARELHDDVSQRIGLLSVELDAIASQIGSDPWRTRLRTLSKFAGEIASDVHQVSYALHPSRLKTLDLVPALQSLCRDMSVQHQLTVRFTHGPIPRFLDGNVSLCLYRIAQEALHNAARHSGTCEAGLSLMADEAHILLEVTDAGVGFTPGQLPSGRLGLASIQERVTYLNGQLEVDAVPGRGTRIAVDIPLEPVSTSKPPSAQAL